MIRINFRYLDDINPVSDFRWLCLDHLIDQIEQHPKFVSGKEEDLVGPFRVFNFVNSVFPLSDDSKIMASASQGPK